MKFYVEVISPLDQVFVGPFEDHAGAAEYAAACIPDHFTTAVMDTAGVQKSMAVYGVIPIQAP